jgi:lysophospholipase L1-like esterase
MSISVSQDRGAAASDSGGAYGPAEGATPDTAPRRSTVTSGAARNMLNTHRRGWWRALFRQARVRVKRAGAKMEVAMRAWTVAAALPLTIALGEDVARAATWTGTWSVSPQSSSTTFAQQTLRQIVHTSISGTAARIQLSNVFGTQPVTIADIHIAQRSTGSSIVAGSDVPVTFGGQPSTTVAVGDLAVSDSIAFPVTALSDVSISMYIPEPVASATSHQLGLQTNYVASGDVSGDATLTNPQTNGSYYFLVNLDVQNPAATGAVAALGASITDGYTSTSDANERWPNDLASRLLGAGLTVGVLNQGISGNDLLTDGAGQSALHRFSRDVLSQPGVQWVIVSDDPINDLGSSNPPAADQLIAGLQQLIASAHQSGLKYLCSTLTPFEGAAYWTPTGETGREAINAFVRSSSSGCDGIVDQDTATHNPAAPTEYLPAYDSGDHLHPNDLGYQAIANCVDLTLFDVGAPPEDGGSVTDATADAAENGADAAEDGHDGQAASEAGDAGPVAAFDAAPAQDAGSGAANGGSGCAASPSASAAPAPLSASAFALLVAAGLAARKKRSLPLRLPVRDRRRRA